MPLVLALALAGLCLPASGMEDEEDDDVASELELLARSGLDALKGLNDMIASIESNIAEDDNGADGEGALDAAEESEKSSPPRAASPVSYRSSPPAPPKAERSAKATPASPHSTGGTPLPPKKRPLEEDPLAWKAKDLKQWLKVTFLPEFDLCVDLGGGGERGEVCLSACWLCACALGVYVASAGSEGLLPLGRAATSTCPRRLKSGTWLTWLSERSGRGRAWTTVGNLTSPNLHWKVLAPVGWPMGHTLTVVVNLGFVYGSGGADKGPIAPPEGVVALESTAFQGQLLTSEDIWFVHFHAPWCKASTAVETEWKTAAAQLNGTARLATMNCAAGEENRGICRRLSVKAYPTMLMFGREKTIDATEFYSWPRTADTFTKFVKRRIEEEKAGFPPNVVQGRIIRTCQIEDTRCWAELQMIVIQGAMNSSAARPRKQEEHPSRAAPHAL